MRLQDIIKKYNDALSFLSIITLGNITGFIACLIFFSPHSSKALSTILKDYQTLLGAFLAIIAAILTIKKMQKDIDVQKDKISADEKRHNQNMQLQNLVARSQLAHAASNLMEHMQECLQYIIQADRGIPTPPIFPINTIMDTIPHTDVETARSLYTLAAFYQIYNSRLRGMSSTTPHRDRASKIHDTVLVNHYAIRLLQYARSDVSSLKLEENYNILRDDMHESERDLLRNYYNLLDSGTLTETRQYIDVHPNSLPIKEEHA